MLTKNDLLTILLDLEEKEDSTELGDKINQLMTSRNIDLDILKFVNDKRPLEVGEFYAKLRKNYNDKKSSLYINIMRETQIPEEAPITLGALALQIMLFGKKIENKKSFFNCTRLKEILDCLSYYSTTYDVIECIKLIKLIKCDIKAFNYITGHEDLQGNIITSKK